jgi:hypothetical protein
MAASALLDEEDLKEFKDEAEDVRIIEPEEVETKQVHSLASLFDTTNLLTEEKNSGWSVFAIDSISDPQLISKANSHNDPQTGFGFKSNDLTDSIQKFKRWVSPCPITPKEGFLHSQPYDFTVHLQSTKALPNLTDFLTNQKRSENSFGDFLKVTGKQLSAADPRSFKPNLKGNRLALLRSVNLVHYKTEGMPYPTRVNFGMQLAGKKVKEWIPRKRPVDGMVCNWDSDKESGVFLEPDSSQFACNALVAPKLPRFCECDPGLLPWHNRLLGIDTHALKSRINKKKVNKERGVDLLHIDITDLVNEKKTSDMLTWIVAYFYPFIGEQTTHHVVKKTHADDLQSYQPIHADNENKKVYLHVLKSALVAVVDKLEEYSGRSMLLDAEYGIGTTFRVCGGQEQARSLFNEYEALNGRLRDDFDAQMKEIIDLQCTISLSFFCLTNPEKVVYGAPPSSSVKPKKKSSEFSLMKKKKGRLTKSDETDEESSSSSSSSSSEEEEDDKEPRMVSIVSGHFLKGSSD